MNARFSALDGLELRHLRYLLALVELQSFREAAAFLAIPREVLSREIATIEQTLGASLFQRFAHGVFPTPAAHDIAAIARRAFASRVVDARETPSDVTLSMGCLDYGRAQVIQRAALAEFQARHPHIVIRLALTPFREQLRALVDGTLGIAFFPGPKPTLPGLAAEALLADTVGHALLPAGHRLARLEQPSVSDLSGVPLHTIAMDDLPELMAGLYDSVRHAGWRGQQTEGSSLPSEALTMIACGAGWAPGTSSTVGLTPAGVAVRPLADGSLLDFDLHVVWREAHLLSTEFVELLLELRDVIDSVLAPRPSTEGDRKSGYGVLLAQRHAERARIAREMHDTILQDLLGSQLELEALTRRLPPSLHSEHSAVRQVIERLGRAGRHGREVVRKLRAGHSTPRDLSLALSNVAEELQEATELEFQMRVNGTPRELRASVGELVFYIGAEAITNAFQHASPSLVSIWLDYMEGTFRLRVSDDGVGIAQELLSAGGRPGHFGLALMQERAEEVGGTLNIQRNLRAGTTVELVVPGHTAFDISRPQVS